MNQALIKAPKGKDITVSYADNISIDVIRDDLTRKVAEHIRDGFNIASIVYELISQTEARIIYIDEHGRNIRELIPILALTQSHQEARNMLNSMDLDDDLAQEARKELDDKRRKRRSE